MSFNWPSFLGHHGIHYVTRGPNTGRGRISVKCPWCGESDPSEHLGISLQGTHWGCLRNSRHRGTSRSYLIAALLRCSHEEAQRLAGEESASPPPTDEDFAAIIAVNLGLEDYHTPPKPLTYPSEFKPLVRKGLGLPFWEYIADRGFSDSQVRWLAEQYNLHYATKGEFRYRLIIPIFSERGKLLSWTGRSIANDNIRYKTLSLTPQPGYTGPLALDTSFNLLLGLPLLWRVQNASVLVICEGPFDALKISALGYERGVYGTCLFGLNVSEPQAWLLEDLKARFDKIVLLIDPDAELMQLRLLDQLSRLRVSVGRLPPGIKDPGDLSAGEASNLFQDWLSKGR
jgi:hypothetical protein